MAFPYFLFSLFVFFIDFIIFGTTLNVENIIGGYPTMLPFFQYHVSILGQLDYYDEYHLLCGGGIISELFIISAAQCFVDGSRMLRPFSFSVAAATNDLNSTIGYHLHISKIMLPKTKNRVVEDDIALAKLRIRIDFIFYSNLSKLILPQIEESFTYRIAVVAGSGYTWVVNDIHPITRKIFRADGGTDYKLKYANVFITSSNECYNMYQNLNTSKHMCGVMLTEKPNTASGICTRDTGSPLVLNNVVVGIASRNTPECDDTVIGCIYIKIKAYLPFILRVLEESIMDGINIYVNRDHIAEQKV